MEENEREKHGGMRRTKRGVIRSYNKCRDELRAQYFQTEVFETDSTGIFLSRPRSEK